MNAEVLGAARAARVTLAGSLLAVPARSRLDAARDLVAAGAWLHTDLIDTSYPLGRGVDVELVDELVRRYPDRVDVHVIGSATLLDRLAGRPARITVHARDGAEARGALARTTGIAPETWLSIEPGHWSPGALAAVVAECGPDGVVAMLTPPGDPRHRADLSGLDSDTWRAACARVPVGADGGVRARDVAPLAAAGAAYVVVGRALLGRPRDIPEGAA